ncbi:hypothetical protein MYP_2769 [Sporocytophaga myxococcoides]|uniref:Uncharacterized protein n=1 Tax=Sporocytophaga myxococcoides TaxID=153721 RepID=A0A098LF18_9BACT|nr:hypothetical protein [Sporocytophaga myxococcoides]GAL85540.1 hypothetical protein MYP_2769 [Sporocytophaga myxococcoides]
MFRVNTRNKVRAGNIGCISNPSSGNFQFSVESNESSAAKTETFRLGRKHSGC